MSRQVPDWDSYVMGLVYAASVRSKDPHTQMGAVIVGPDGGVRSTGYNSFPRGIDDSRPERYERPEKYSWIEHSDRNAIYAAAKVGTPLNGCTMYLPTYPCMDCARAIVQVGIVEVVYDANRHAEWAAKTPQYGEHFERVEQLFKEAGVRLRGWNKS